MSAPQARESEKELDNLFNSLILRLSLDSFSASPNQKNRGRSADHSLRIAQDVVQRGFRGELVQ